MTQREFNLLPLNLKPFQAKLVLGTNDEGLRTLRQSHPEMVVRQCGKGQHVYSKSVIATLAKLKFE